MDPLWTIRITLLCYLVIKFIHSMDYSKQKELRKETVENSISNIIVK
jgi:hypothetical protein